MFSLGIVLFIDFLRTPARNYCDPRGEVGHDDIHNYPAFNNNDSGIYPQNNTAAPESILVPPDY